MSRHTSTQHRVRFLRVVFLITALFMLRFQPGQAQEQSWQPQILDSGPAIMPVLLVDAAGTVHALWIHLGRFDESNSSPDTIYYAHRTKDGGWSKPVDVLMPPTGTVITDLDAVIDSRDIIHLIALSDSGLWYSSTQSTNASSAWNWTSWTRLSSAQAGPSTIALGPDDSLHVVYPQIFTAPDQVYYIGSSDSGGTWNPPVPISNPSDPNTQPVNATIAVASLGRLHVAWTETIEEFPPAGVFYAYSDDQGQTWSAPRMMADRGHNWISIGIEKNESRVHLIWAGTGEVAGKYHALSTDGGETWEPVTTEFYGWAGYLGRSRFALDSAGQIHLATALGGDTTANPWPGPGWSSPGDIFLSTWDGTAWLTPEHVSSSVTETELEQAWPSVATSEGNLLHVAWSGTYHPEDNVRPIWYASKRIDAPLVRPQLRPTENVEVAATAITQKPVGTQPAPDATNVAQEHLLTSQPSVNNIQRPSSNLPVPVIAGSASALLLVIVVVGVMMSRRASK